MADVVRFERTGGGKQGTLTRVVKAVSTASTAVAIVTAGTYVSGGNLQARRTAGNNIGNIFIGLSTEDQGVLETFELEPGESLAINSLIPLGGAFDLGDLYLDADNDDDGVVGIVTVLG